MKRPTAGQFIWIDRDGERLTGQIVSGSTGAFILRRTPRTASREDLVVTLPWSILDEEPWNVVPTSCPLCGSHRWSVSCNAMLTFGGPDRPSGYTGRSLSMDSDGQAVSCDDCGAIPAPDHPAWLLAEQVESRESNLTLPPVVATLTPIDKEAPCVVCDQPAAWIDGGPLMPAGWRHVSRDLDLAHPAAPDPADDVRVPTCDCGNQFISYEENLIDYRSGGVGEPDDEGGGLIDVSGSSNTGDGGDGCPGLFCDNLAYTDRNDPEAGGCGAPIILPEGWEESWG